MRLIAVLIFISSAAIAQTCNWTFSGRVTTANGNVLPDAIISLTGTTGRVANADGSFMFANICSGTYTIRVQYLGYKTIELQQLIEGNVEKNFTLEPEAEQLKEVVVQSKSENIDNVQNFVKLNEKDLAATAGKTLGESLREISGVNTIQAGPGIFKPVIHGVHSTRVLILNHGIRQEGQQWGAEHAPEVDPFIASEMIVIKDASAIKYGTDALGGVIVVNPAPLPEEAGIGGSINIIGQTNGRAGTTSGALEGGFKDIPGWGWRLQGTAKRAGDYFTPKYSLTNTGSNELDFSAATGYHGKKFGAEIFFSHFQTKLGILKGTSIGNADDLVTAIENSPPQYTSDFSYSIASPHQQVSHNLLKINAHRETEKGDFHFQYGLQRNARKEFDLRRDSLSDLPAIDLQLTTHTFEGEFEFNKSESRSFCFGANWMFQENNNIFGTKRIPFIPNYTSMSGGPFAVARLLFNSWTIDLGTRYDFRSYNVVGYDFKNTLFRDNLNFHNISATAGATLQLKKNQSLSFNVSSAWRPPHVAELYSLGTHQSAAAIEYGLLLNDTSNAVMNIEDVDFKIEQALKWVGTYRIQKEKFQFEATAYANFIFNYIYLKATGVTQNIRGTYPYFRYTQTDALFVGLDLTSEYQVTKRFALAPKVSFLKASDYRNHDYLVFIPSNRFELTGHYEIPKAGKLMGLFFEARARYTMRQVWAPRVVTVRDLKDAHEEGVNIFENDNSNFDFLAAPDGYFLLSASAGFAVPSKHGRYEFRVSGDNLLNTSYREYTNRFRYYADELGRNVVVGVKYIF